MMSCRECGNPFQEDSFLCPQCGARNQSYLERHPQIGQNQQETDLASRLQRFGAAIIDLFIYFGAAIPVGSILGLLNFKGLSESVSLQNIIITVAIISGIYLVMNGYLLAKNGQSIGKLIIGIKIVRDDREKASLQRIIGLRLFPVFVLINIPLIGLFIGLFDVLSIFREEKNCLHDDLADTRVVKA